MKVTGEFWVKEEIVMPEKGKISDGDLGKDDVSPQDLFRLNKWNYLMTVLS